MFTVAISILFSPRHHTFGYMLGVFTRSRTLLRNLGPTAARITPTPYRMSSSSTFVEKVQALQPELAGSTEEDKGKIQSLVNEVPSLAKDLQVSVFFEISHM